MSCDVETEICSINDRYTHYIVPQLLCSLEYWLIPAKLLRMLQLTGLNTNHTIDNKFACVPFLPNVHTLIKTAVHIPGGRLMKPLFSTWCAARLAEESDALHQRDPTNPWAPEISKEIKPLVRPQSHLGKCRFNVGSCNLWQIIKQLPNPTKKTGNVAIPFKDNIRSSGNKCTDEFNRQFTEHPALADKSIRDNAIATPANERFSNSCISSFKSATQLKALKVRQYSAQMVFYKLCWNNLALDNFTNVKNLSRQAYKCLGSWK